MSPTDTLPPIPQAGGWRERIESMDRSFAWARRLGAAAVVHMLSGNEAQSYQLGRTGAHFAREGLALSSGT